MEPGTTLKMHLCSILPLVLLSQLIAAQGTGISTFRTSTTTNVQGGVSDTASYESTTRITSFITLTAEGSFGLAATNTSSTASSRASSASSSSSGLSSASAGATNSAVSPDNNLSVGAVVGIAVGCAVSVGLALLFSLALLRCRRVQSHDAAGKTVMTPPELEGEHNQRFGKVGTVVFRELPVHERPQEMSAYILHQEMSADIQHHEMATAISPR